MPLLRRLERELIRSGSSSVFGIGVLHPGLQEAINGRRRGLELTTVFAGDCNRYNDSHRGATLIWGFRQLWRTVQGPAPLRPASRPSNGACPLAALPLLPAKAPTRKRCARCSCLSCRPSAAGSMHFADRVLFEDDDALSVSGNRIDAAGDGDHVASSDLTSPA